MRDYPPPLPRKLRFENEVQPLAVVEAHDSAHRIALQALRGASETVMCAVRTPWLSACAVPSKQTRQPAFQQGETRRALPVRQVAHYTVRAGSGLQPCADVPADVV